MFCMDFFSKRYVSPRSTSDVPDYPASFRQALRFTADLGFSAPNVDAFTFGRPGVVTEAGVRSALAAAGIKDLSYSGAQCLKWCHYLAPYFSASLQCSVAVTLGQLWDKGEAIYSPTWRDFRKWAKRGVQIEDLQKKEGFNCHAWLTAASGEIIEVSFLSTLSMFGGRDHLRGGLCFGEEAGLLAPRRYFPMVVGAEIAEAINKRSCLSFLAKDFDDLFRYPLKIVPTS